MKIWSSTTIRIIIIIFVFISPQPGETFLVQTPQALAQVLGLASLWHFLVCSISQNSWTDTFQTFTDILIGMLKGWFESWCAWHLFEVSCGGENLFSVEKNLFFFFFSFSFTIHMKLGEVWQWYTCHLLLFLFFVTLCTTYWARRDVQKIL